MKHYKVGKYDYSDSSYKNDWTSIWDFIDPDTAEGKLSEDYRKSEKRYIDFAMSFLTGFDSSKLSLSEVEDNRKAFTKELLTKVGEKDLDINALDLKGKNIDSCSISNILKLSLRNVVWFKVLHDEGFYLAFGNDYYWLIGAPENVDIDRLATASGLYAYETRDPWL